ncbi:hypothetical protein B0H11DRAFT_1862921 [Mycena galericulata]|nr:hypothetical protein B0H11DRAFT_1862921 [Mycena galericulata]
MSRLIAFIIGSGANVGKHTAAALKAKGYQVAVGSRKPVFDQAKKDGYFPVAVDAGNPGSIKAAFAKINKELGPPNVVIFNAGLWEAPEVPADPLTLSLDSFTRQAGLGLFVFAAAQEAVQGFRSDIHKDALKTFIVTGNPLPWVPATSSSMVALNIQKVTQWRLMELFASVYAKERIRFYYATLVSESGGILDPLSQFFTSGPQHAQVYSDLITREDQAEWDYRFTLKGEKWTKK